MGIGADRLLFLGLDVQMRRGVSCSVMDEAARVRDTRWLVPAAGAPAQIAVLLEELGPERCQVGIDAPRHPLPRLRVWSWTAGRGWHRTRGKRGRHCDLAVRALGLANPQWTPLRSDAPAWMRLGFALFAAVEEAGAVAHEVFPSATYAALERAGCEESVSLPLHTMRPGPKDMLDAVAGSFTVLRLHAGEGCEVGGGDGLGPMVLPTPTRDHPVLCWPEDRSAPDGEGGRR